MPSSKLFKVWLSRVAHGKAKHVAFYAERVGGRASALPILEELVADHFVGLAVVASAGGFVKAADVIRNSLPTAKRTQSGDLAELLGTEYVNGETKFTVPLKKLQYKSDREMAMRGDDIIGIDVSGARPLVLKGECKSRINLTAATVKQAATGLDRHGGRPNASTMAFITKRLYAAGKDAEAKVFQHLQTAGAIRAPDVVHLVFSLCGNDAVDALGAVPASKHAGIARVCAAIRVPDHAAFVASAFK